MSDENGNGISRIGFVWEAHEERLQALEDDRVGTASSLSEQTAYLKVIKNDIHDLKDAAKENNKVLYSLFEKIQKNAESDNDRLLKLEHKDLIKNDRWYLASKLVYGLWAVGGGILMIVLEKLLSH